MVIGLSPSHCFNISKTILKAINTTINRRVPSLACLFTRRISTRPVLADQIQRLLDPQDGKVYIDMTFGDGGHSKHLLDTNKSIKIIAVDRDPVAFHKAQQLAALVAKKNEQLNINQSVIPILGKFSQVSRAIHLSGIPYATVNGVIFDLGASETQLSDPSRGFSIHLEGPLDMRMDPTNPADITAEDVINNLTQRDLTEIFKLLGPERKATKLASAILDARTLMERIRTTSELAKIISNSRGITGDVKALSGHPGSRVFKALRVFVNNELNELNYALEKVQHFLIPAYQQKENPNDDYDPTPDGQNAGIAIVITYNPIEDRIVKRHFLGVDINEPDIHSLSQQDRIRTNQVMNGRTIRDREIHKKWKLVSKHVIKPDDAEKASNPRSSSAKLRAAIRISLN